MPHSLEVKKIASHAIILLLPHLSSCPLRSDPALQQCLCTSLFHAAIMTTSILREAPLEVAIHLCQMASAHPQETRTTSIFREAPGEVAIHLCLLASAHPQEELTACMPSCCSCHQCGEFAEMFLTSLFHARFIGR